MPAHVKKGDVVIVTAGDDKGKTGEIVSVDTKANRVVVRGVNIHKRHLKPTQGRPQGAIVEMELPIHMSNVSPVVDGKPSRVRFVTKPDGSKVQMWDPGADLEGDWRDRPCNTAIYFDCRGGRLNMTVTCRSNDILWGCYGANVVHMSMLQELVAHAVNRPVGVYRQFSNNWHAYLGNPQVQNFLDTPPMETHDYYAERNVRPYPLLQGSEQYEHLLEDCDYFLEGRTSMRTHFMRDVAVPLRDAYLARAGGEKINWISLPEYCDWTVAFAEWCDRRDCK